MLGEFACRIPKPDSVCTWRWKYQEATTPAHMGITVIPKGDGVLFQYAGSDLQLGEWIWPEKSPYIIFFLFFSQFLFYLLHFLIESLINLTFYSIWIQAFSKLWKEIKAKIQPLKPCVLNILNFLIGLIYANPERNITCRGPLFVLPAYLGKSLDTSGCPGRLCTLLSWRLSRQDWVNPWATWSDLFPDTALTRRLD